MPPKFHIYIIRAAPSQLPKNFRLQNSARTLRLLNHGHISNIFSTPRFSCRPHTIFIYNIAIRLNMVLEVDKQN
jgi:hypothetical protein